jgi:hypothetical protein
MFPLHFWVLLKKRILMQIRDRKTLTIDLVFPLLLIIVGIFLTQVSFFSETGERQMTPFLYPEPLNIWKNNEARDGNKQNLAQS